MRRDGDRRVRGPGMDAAATPPGNDRVGRELGPTQRGRELQLRPQAPPRQARARPHAGPGHGRAQVLLTFALVGLNVRFLRDWHPKRLLADPWMTYLADTSDPDWGKSPAHRTRTPRKLSPRESGSGREGAQARVAPRAQDSTAPPTAARHHCRLLGVPDQPRPAGIVPTRASPANGITRRPRLRHPSESPGRQAIGSLRRPPESVRPACERPPSRSSGGLTTSARGGS